MPNHYTDRRFVIFNTSELSTIDFNQVFETSADTVRKSIDETQAFVKYEGTMPATVAALTTKSQEYTIEELKTILLTSHWSMDPTEI